MTQGYLGLGNIYLRSIRGTEQNNVISAGEFGLILHYNGSTWEWYPNLFRYPEGRFLLSVSISDNMAFIAGGQDGYGIIIIGRKQ